VRSGGARETHCEAGRGHPLKRNALDLAALAAVYLEPHVDERVSAVLLGLTHQSLDGRLTIGFRDRVTGGAPTSCGPDSANSGHRATVIRATRKTHLHEVKSV
jgi:hypothetical protein